MGEHTVVAVCGKGGVGKTAISGCLVRALSERGKRVLAVDADPALGLGYVLGVPQGIRTLGNVKDELIANGRDHKSPDRIVGMIDYLLLEALHEDQAFSFLAMGRSLDRGCFCPLNTLLKKAIERMTRSYDVLVVDAEAGLEQLNRQVMSSVDSIIIVTDNSLRSEHSMETIMQMVQDLKMQARIGIVKNRWKKLDGMRENSSSTSAAAVLETIPEDETLLLNDARGKSVFCLPDDSSVLKSARKMLDFIA